MAKEKRQHFDTDEEPGQRGPKAEWRDLPIRIREDNLDRQAVSIMKAAEIVGVSRRTIYNWLASGKLEYVRTAGGSVRIFTDSLWRDADGSSEQSAPSSVATSRLTALGS